MGAVVCGKESLKYKKKYEEESRIEPNSPSETEKSIWGQNNKKRTNLKQLNFQNNISKSTESRNDENQLKWFHGKFPPTQFDYFNEEEMNYYKEKVPSIKKKKLKVKKTINCIKENIIGRGSFGAVYKGFDKNNRNVPMAIKTIQIHNFKDK